MSIEVVQHIDVSAERVIRAFQHLPETSSNDRVHELTADCWCKPRVESVPPAIKHRDAAGKAVNHTPEG